MGKMKVTPFLNKNSRMAKAYGKWFMRAKPYGALDMEDLSNHIAMDSKVERTMVSQITKAVVKQMKELLMNGHPIRIPHLGLLKVQVSTEGAETKEAFNAGKHVKNAHLILVPTTEIKEEMRKMKFEKDYDPTKPYDVVTDDDDDGGETPTNNGGTDDNETGGENSGSENVTAPEISGQTPFTDSTEVTIQGPQGAEVRYTTDGSDPTAESTLYSEAITLNATTTIKAIAILDGETSAVASKTFTKSGESGGFDLGN